MKLSPRSRVGALALLLVFALAFGLAACGGVGTSTSSGGSSQPLTLNCVSTQTPHPIDTVSVEVTCTVTNAPSAATSFILNYAVVGAGGQSHPLSPTCQAPIQHGTGVCAKTYDLPFPLANGKFVVTGSLLPTHQALGPVTPVKSAGG
ncbi:MAG TPA: hypothetical protein VKQ36_12420 [Ktedonobacterales bacterium]|nr:hypothetical protein [Ktedonobacterales bacterium]